MATTTLKHINVPPAQTWNYLHVNDISLEVPAAPETPVAAPSELSALEMGAGAEAAAWQDSVAATRKQVHVAAHTSADIEINLDDADALLASNIVVEEGAVARICVVQTASAADVASHVLRIAAAKDAQVTLYDLVAGEGTRYLNNIGVELGENAHLDVRQYVLSGKVSASGIAINQAGERSKVELVCRYLAGRNETVDITLTSRMRGCNTRCNFVASGVLSDGATKTLRDTIDLVHGAKGARGRENETVLLAGDPLVNKSLPTILCDEDDVAGDHGATIGSITADQLAYLADRGLTEDDATELFAHAVADDAYNHAPTKAAKDAVIAATARVFGAQAAALLGDVSEEK